MTFVLSCGAVETPRLWLNSALPNPNGWVGVGLTDHFVDAVSGLMPFDTGMTRGPGSNGRIDYPGVGMLEVVGETPGLWAGLGAFSDAGIAGAYNNGYPYPSYGADRTGRLIGRSPSLCKSRRVCSSTQRLAQKRRSRRPGRSPTSAGARNSSP